MKQKLRKTGNEDTNESVWEWFVSVMLRNLYLDQWYRNMQRKLLKNSGKSEFKASNGWINSFRRRHKIVINEDYDKAGDVCEETVADQTAKLSSIAEGYDPKNIANGDKTRLSFHALPSKALCLKGERCTGGKHSEQRLSFPPWFYDWED
jgi:hypothetical protein